MLCRLAYNECCVVLRVTEPGRNFKLIIRHHWPLLAGELPVSSVLAAAVSSNSMLVSEKQREIYLHQLRNIDKPRLCPELICSKNWQWVTPTLLTVTTAVSFRMRTIN